MREEKKQNNMRNLDRIIFIAVIILLSIISWNLFIKPDKEEPLTYDYDTITKRMDITISNELEKIRSELRKYTEANPRIVEKYITEKPIYYINNYTDSIITITDTINNVTQEINTDFLTLYPFSDKLINFNVDSDSLSFTLFNTHGETFRKSWPTDFDNYRYVYIDNKLMFRKTPSKKKITKNNFNNLYLNMGYDLYNNGLQPSLEYDIKLHKRFKVSAEVKRTFSEIPFNEASLKLGFRLLN